MLKVSLTAGAPAVAMLVAMTVGKAQAAPALKPEIAKTEGVTLVGPVGGGGFGGRRGGPKFGYFGGGGGGPRLAASVVAAAVCAGATSAVAGCQCARCAVATSDQKLAPSGAAFRGSTGAVTSPICASRLAEIFGLFRPKRCR